MTVPAPGGFLPPLAPATWLVSAFTFTPRLLRVCLCVQICPLYKGSHMVLAPPNELILT